MACVETLKSLLLAAAICVGLVLHCAPGDGSGDSVAAVLPVTVAG